MSRYFFASINTITDRLEQNVQTCAKDIDNALSIIIEDKCFNTSNKQRYNYTWKIKELRHKMYINMIHLNTIKSIKHFINVNQNDIEYEYLSNECILFVDNEKYYYCSSKINSLIENNEITIKNLECLIQLSISDMILGTLDDTYKCSELYNLGFFDDFIHNEQLVNGKAKLIVERKMAMYIFVNSMKSTKNKKIKDEFFKYYIELSNENTIKYIIDNKCTSKSLLAYDDFIVSPVIQYNYLDICEDKNSTGSLFLLIKDINGNKFNFYLDKNLNNYLSFRDRLINENFISENNSYDFFKKFNGFIKKFIKNNHDIICNTTFKTIEKYTKIINL